MNVGENMINLFGKKTAAQGGAVEYIVAGLGNPGRQYENTRHNAGFIALDKLADKYNCNVSKMKYKALIGDCTIAGKEPCL